MVNKINVNQIAKETIIKMKLKSPYAIPANAAERGLKFQEIRQYLTGYALDTQDSIISEIERIIKEINEGFDKINAEINYGSNFNSNSSFIISENEPEEFDETSNNFIWFEVLN